MTIVQNLPKILEPGIILGGMSCFYKNTTLSCFMKTTCFYKTTQSTLDPGIILGAKDTLHPPPATGKHLIFFSLHCADRFFTIGKGVRRIEICRDT